jgi:dTMP kinase
VRGAFVTLEGIEGVGKSTNLAFVERELRELGHDVLVTREPGGTVLGEKIRDWILNERHASLSAEVEALLMFAARSHHLDHVIRPALTAGRWVVCDRFTDATFAYQGGGRGMEARLLGALTNAVHGDLCPDLTLLLDVPVDTSFERIGARDPDRFEREDREFFERVRAAYLRLAEQYPARIEVIDASQSLEAVQRAIGGKLAVLSGDFRG